MLTAKRSAGRVMSTVQHNLTEDAMRAKAECKICQGIQDAVRDDDGRPVYVCRCCYNVTPRRVNHSKKREAKRARLEGIIASLVHFD